jgi:hypothetical protein
MWLLVGLLGIAACKGREPPVHRRGGPIRACLAHWAGAPHLERLRVSGVSFEPLNRRRALVSLRNNCNQVSCETVQDDGRWRVVTLFTTDMECPGAEDPGPDL